MKKQITLIALVSCLLAFSCTSDSEKPVTESKAQEKKLEVIFDVPSLVNKDIKEIKKILGKPTSDTEPTNAQLEGALVSWDKTFSKNGYDLIVTYNPNTGVVIDFFVGTKDPSGKTKDYNDLLQIANVSKSPENIIVKPIRAIADPSYYTGIKISKNRELKN